MSRPEADVPHIARRLADLLAAAGDATMEIFRRDDQGLSRKSDDSPVTEADLASQRILVAGLRELGPELLGDDVPIIAEESAAAAWSERRHWTRTWLVDPLDGTREFISGRGEFTVNVALVDGGRPVLGAVRAPVLGKTWLGCAGFEDTTGSWLLDEDGSHAICVSAAATPTRVVASRSHRSAEVDAFLGHYGEHELVSMGSSLKLCVLAEGRADLYPRLGRTMEWDIAAADAVLRGAGGRVVAPGADAAEPEPLAYNKEDLANPFFLTTGDDSLRWQEAWAAALGSRGMQPVGA